MGRSGLIYWNCLSGWRLNLYANRLVLDPGTKKREHMRERFLGFDPKNSRYAVRHILLIG